MPLCDETEIEKVGVPRLSMPALRVIALPGGEETIRGYSGVNLLIIDEAARVADELVTFIWST